MKNVQLVNLSSRAWSLTALGLMASGVPGRVSPLAAEAGCGRISMSASMEHLMNLGMVERNPGHGHPLRPEFRLTSSGRDVADWAYELNELVGAEKDRALLRTKWTLPLLICLPEEKRYSDLRRQLNPVTDRALSKCLSNLTQSEWLKRRVGNEVSPPLVTYRTIKMGRAVSKHLEYFPNVA